MDERARRYHQKIYMSEYGVHPDKSKPFSPVRGPIRNVRFAFPCSPDRAAGFCAGYIYITLREIVSAASPTTRPVDISPPHLRDCRRIIVTSRSGQRIRRGSKTFRGGTRGRNTLLRLSVLVHDDDDVDDDGGRRRRAVTIAMGDEPSAASVI
mmetsp:Transcript_41506/g.125758  ORF Transcript_41506/g.125758 Transcript_41506/m.125758 type:complete len:153 (-) Transcript_41506:218-676(-)